MIVSSATTAQRLVILLHGLGGSGAMMMPIVGPWRQSLPGTRFAAPDAPFPSAQGGRVWFRIDGQELRPDHIEMVREEFDRLVADLVEREGFQEALDRVAFVGVSQGAIMALDAAASGRWKVGALVSFAGLLPLRPVVTETKMPILLVHGESDPRIPATASMAAAGQLKTAGFDVTLKILPGVGHTISPDGAEAAFLFLKKNFAV